MFFTSSEKLKASGIVALGCVGKMLFYFTYTALDMRLPFRGL